MLHPLGHEAGFQVPNIPTLFKQLPQILETLGRQNHVNAYYTLAHHLNLGKATPSRNAESFHYQTVLPFDIDHTDKTRACEYLSCVALVLKVESPQLTLISTGNGLHVLAQLKTPIRSTKFLKELKPAYNELVHKLQKLMDGRGLPGKPDPVVFDAARVFRLPGTANQKPGAPVKFSELLQYADFELDIDIQEVSGVDQLAKENISPEQIRRQYPKPDMQKVVEECRFVRWTLDKPEELHEPQVFDLFSLMGAMPPAARIIYEAREQSAIEVAESVFNKAAAGVSKSLARTDFKAKWEASSRYGARKCSTIANNTIGVCQTCPHFQKIPTPLALKSESHVGSEDLGFWVLNAKGNHAHPHYADLSKVYAQENSFVTTKDERIFTFTGTHYTEVTSLIVKAWLERKVTPSDPIRDMHRNEFVKKIEVVGAMTSVSEDQLFQKSTEGKLNARNGVIDILKGEMLPHAPQMGFQYVLPYDYIPDESSELFLDWLDEVTIHREELMEALLDIMAYALWPTYDDHLFTYLVGEGANGKGTFIHIIQALVGKENYSSISVPQLGSNRFAPASLEGKLINLSEESSGYDMGFEEMNVIKNLSAGGEIFAERKGVQGFVFQNKAKMIFSANKTPRFREGGHALKRRLLAIPFDYTFTSPDPRIEKQLLLEVPKIMSMLIRRIQENVKTNGGRFVVHRGGKSAQDAQDKVLLAGNTVIEWAKEEVESSTNIPEQTYIPTSDAYMKYSTWCQQNNYKTVNKGLFSHFMYERVVTPAVHRDDNVIKVGNKAARVFKRTRYREEAVL
jgi:P4 family phage/plasmid primase-like protien